MDDIGKEEVKNMEEVEEKKILSETHVHAQEEAQEPNPNPSDGVELETQKSIDDNGIELLPSELRGPVDSVPGVLKTPEDADIATNPSNELEASTESDKLVSNGDSGVHFESEVVESEDIGSEKGEAMEDDRGSKVNPSIEVPMEIEKVGDGVEEETALKADMGSKVDPSVELCGSAETGNVVGDGGSHCTEVPMEIEKVRDGVEEEKALKDGSGSKVDPSVELCASAEAGNLVGDGGLSHTEMPMEIEKEDDRVEEGKALKDGVSSKVNSSIEQDISAETDNIACKMELDMPCDSEVSKEKLIDGASSEANPSSETHIGAETDNVVSKVESGIMSDSEVTTEKLIDGMSIKAKSSNEPDSSAETDNVACKMELDMPRDSEVAMEKLTDGVSNEADPSRETHSGAETDNVVSIVDAGMLHDSEVAAEKLIDGMSNKAKSSNELDSSAGTDIFVSKVEPEMSRDSGVATAKLIDAVSSEANPSSEPHISAETDNSVCKEDLDVPCDSEVATEKLIDGVSSEVNPSSELHISTETDNAVCEVELDMPHDSKFASEKLIHGLRSKTNPPNEPHMSAETNSVVREVEPGKVPSDSGTAMEKLTDRLNSTANPSIEPRISAETDNFVSKVESNVPRDDEVEMETRSDDDGEKGEVLKGGVNRKTMLSLSTDINEQGPKPKFYVGRKVGMKSLDPKPSFLLGPGASEDDGSGTEEEQVAFMKEVENLYKEKNLEFKAPKFYREGLNLLKLWRAVIKLGGYEKVTSCKLWRQVGESFNPPKTCTTVSWTFRNFYEKALLEFEKDRLHGGQLALPVESTRVENRADSSQTLGSGRALRDAAARAMQGWHSQRHLGNGEVGDAIIKDKHLSTTPKSDKQLRSSGLLKRKKPSHVDYAVQVADMKAIKPRSDIMVFDIGPPADWVKINVKRFNDCFEVYALVPGLLREEVHVQTDPAGRLIISGQPRQLDNPWGVTPFKKVVSLPLRIDPQQTSAVVTLNGQLFVRVPFEQSDF